MRSGPVLTPGREGGWWDTGPTPRRTTALHYPKDGRCTFADDKMRSLFSTIHPSVTTAVDDLTLPGETKWVGPTTYVRPPDGGRGHRTLFGSRDGPFVGGRV